MFNIAEGSSAGHITMITAKLRWSQPWWKIDTFLLSHARDSNYFRTDFLSHQSIFPSIFVGTVLLFSPLKPKAQMHYCDRPLSVVCPSSLTFRISNFSETAEWNLTKLDRKPELNGEVVLYQVCSFFFGPIGKQRRPLGFWLVEESSASPLKPLTRIWQNLTGSKNVTPSIKFVFVGPIAKPRWSPWPLIGWYIFDFSSETAERNSTKLDRNQNLDVFYQVCVFLADRIKLNGRPGVWLAKKFSTSALTQLNGIFNKTFLSSYSTFLPSLINIDATGLTPIVSKNFG